MKKELIFVLLLILLPVLGWAQEKNQNNQKNQGTQNTLLPDINPQDIEIRGNFKANFPGLRRQPILGFNPTPPVFRLSPNRIPFMESPNEALVSIPMSKLEPTIAPPRNTFTYPHPSNLAGDLGIGSYISPEASLDAGVDMTPNTIFLTRFNLHSTNGYYTGQNDSRRNMNVAFDINSHLSRESFLNVGVHGLSDFNYRPDGITRNDYGGMGINLGYQLAKNAWNAFTVNARYNYFQVQRADSARKDNEDVLELNMAKSWTGQAMNSAFTLGADALGSQYQIAGPVNHHWYILNPYAGYRWRIGYAHGIDINVNGYYASDPANTNFYIYPDFTYHFWGIENMTFSLNVKGEVINPAMKGQYTSDGIVVPDAKPLNERDISGSAGLEYRFSQGARISVNYNYRKYYSFLYIDRTAPGIYHMLQDHNTRMWRGSIGFTFDLVPNKFTITSQFYLQNQTLSTGMDVPFMENTGFTTALQIHPISKLYIKAWVNYLGDRPYGVNGSLSSAWLPGGRAEYHITKHLGIYVKSTNVLNQAYRFWPDYREMPVQVFGGITFKW